MRVLLVNRKQRLHKGQTINYAQPAKVSLDSLWVLNLDDSGAGVSEKYGTNGATIGFAEPYKKMPEDYLSIKAHINAKSQWSGFIMFQADRGDGHLGQAYAKLRIAGGDNK